MTLQDHYKNLMDEVATAARASGRRPEDIHVVLVSKYGTPEQIRELVELGHRHFGEGRTQQLEQRAAMIREWLVRRQESGIAEVAIEPDAVRWHMVGHLQRNKVRKIVDLVRLLHSVDSLRLAEEIQQVAAARRDEPVEVLIQVNVAGERQKHGVAPAATRHLIEQIDTMFNVRVRGLMCMAPEGEDPEAARAKARPVFTRCHELFDDIQTKGVTSDRFNILSMGMSGDYDVAVECGANVVRVGTAIFGVREDVR